MSDKLPESLMEPEQIRQQLQGLLQSSEIQLVLGRQVWDAFGSEEPLKSELASEILEAFEYQIRHGRGDYALDLRRTFSEVITDQVVTELILPDSASSAEQGTLDWVKKHM